MAGVAGDVLHAVGKLRVDILRQDDHLARDVLFRVLVTGKIAFDVTEVALHAEPDRKDCMVARMSRAGPSTLSSSWAPGAACLA